MDTDNQETIVPLFQMSVGLKIRLAAHWSLFRHDIALLRREPKEYAAGVVLWWQLEALLEHKINSYNDLVVRLEWLIEYGFLIRDERRDATTQIVENTIRDVRDELVILTAVWAVFPHCRQSMSRLDALIGEADAIMDELLTPLAEEAAA